MIETQQFSFKFKCFNKIDKKIYFESTNINEAISFIEDAGITRGGATSGTLSHVPGHELFSFTLKSEQPSTIKVWDYTQRKFNYQLVAPPEWVLLDYFGNIVDRNTIKTAKFNNNGGNSWQRFVEYRKAYQKIGVRLDANKNNAFKIKSSYRKKITTSYESDGYCVYDFISVGYHRRIKTFSQKKQACALISEYGSNIVRSKRNHKNLPSTWDDIPCGVYHTQKSWKHNSKRRKQWKSGRVV